MAGSPEAPWGGQGGGVEDSDMADRAPVAVEVGVDIRKGHRIGHAAVRRGVVG